jgi:chemotaxis protein histidine kinase CheA
MPEGFDLITGTPSDLQRRYLAELPDKSAAIERSWKRLQSEPTNREALSNLSLHVHRLAGSAGPYGLPLLGEVARSVDKVVTPLASSGEIVPSATLKALCPLMAKLRQRLNEPV